MSGITRNEVYRKAIDRDAQTMPDIITLSNIPTIRKRHESFQYSFHRGSPFSIISWQQPNIAGL